MKVPTESDIIFLQEKYDNKYNVALETIESEAFINAAQFNSIVGLDRMYAEEFKKELLEKHLIVLKGQSISATPKFHAGMKKVRRSWKEDGVKQVETKNLL